MNPDKGNPSEQNDRGAPASTVERLEAYIAANQVIAYVPGFADNEYPYIICSLWGVIPTNEIFVRLANGEASFVDCVRSPLEIPAMGDRVFGMDVADENAAGALADQIWERHKHQLIRNGRQ